MCGECWFSGSKISATWWITIEISVQPSVVNSGPTLIQQWDFVCWVWFSYTPTCKYIILLPGTHNRFICSLCEQIQQRIQQCARRGEIAVSFSARPWLDVFALPEKSNKALPESDPDPKVWKMSITFYWLCDLWAEHGVEMLLILKITIFDLITPLYFPIWQSKEMSHNFVRGQSVAETCFSHWG